MTLERRFHLLIGLVLLLGFAIFATVGYVTAKQEAEQSLFDSADRIRNVLMATRRIYHHQFIDSGLPLTEKTLGFLPAHALNRISKDLANWDSSGFSFNNVSDQPRNPEQKADALEMQAMEHFRQFPKDEVRFVPFTASNGEPYYHYARPIWIENYCLDCHGEKAKAPVTIQKLYDTAYGYKVGDLRGILSIKIPARAMQTQLRRSFIYTLAWTGSTLLVLWFIVGLAVRRSVLHPLAKIKQGIDRLAAGKKPDLGFSLAGEFGEIGQAFDAMAETLDTERALLASSEERFRSLATTATDAIILADEQDTIQFWNPGAEKLFGHAASDIVGLPISTIIPERFRESHRMGMARILAGASGTLIGRTTEVSGLHSDDSEIPVEISLNHWASAGRRYFVAIIRDIRERKRQQRELEELNATLETRVAERTKDLQQANNELEAFSYSVSHDLRAPLRALDAYARILKEEESEQLGEDGRRMVERICTNANKMGALIDDILLFARVGRREMHTEDVDMSALVASVVGDLAGEYPRASVLAANLPRVMGDTSMLRQVWTNLISNALKFSSKVEKPEISIGTLVTPQRETAFVVKDNGAGFNMEYADKLFNVFERLHSESEFPGTGAGLAIVKRIVERHGGRVWAEGTIGRGANFYFTLSTHSQLT